mmetsp:Transcript_51625/g.57661  ORF Transcript_51625/g.57661 Transcript_51625/m.57661 type:complete len:205 (+) Transcript_51625:272-886(+)
MGRDARGAQNLMIRITTSSSRLMKFKVKKYPICEVFYEQIEDDNDEEDDFSPTQDNSTSGTIHKKEEIDLFLTDSEDECGLDDLADENNLFDGNNDLTSTQELPNNKTHEKVKKTLKILSSRKSGKSITTISRTKYNSKKSKNSKVKHSELKPEKVTPNFQKKNSKVDCEKARLQSFNIAGTKESKKQQLSAVKRLRSGKKLRK